MVIRTRAELAAGISVVRGFTIAVIGLAAVLSPRTVEALSLACMPMEDHYFFECHNEDCVALFRVMPVREDACEWRSVVEPIEPWDANALLAEVGRREIQLEGVVQVSVHHVLAPPEREDEHRSPEAQPLGGSAHLPADHRCNSRFVVAAGVLCPGERLPSIRELAGQLRINPASAVKTYHELRHEGLIDSDQGRGTFVSREPGVAAATREALLQDDLDALLLRAEARGFRLDEVMDALKARARERENET